jgi:hypothetical protein
MSGKICAKKIAEECKKRVLREFWESAPLRAISPPPWSTEIIDLAENIKLDLGPQALTGRI